MRVGVLQFGPELRALEKNMRRADALLEKLQPGELDLLVLPELAFTGYNYASLSDIKPYLESTASGPSAAWARKTAARLQCIVSVGYPEICENDGYPKDIDGKLHPRPPSYPENWSLGGRDSEPEPSEPSRSYNSLLTVDPSGALIAHYRKTNLYYTDVSWSWPGPDGFGLNAYQLPLKLFSDPPEPESNAASAEPSVWEEKPSSGDQERSITPAAFGICMDLNPMHFIAPWEDYELAMHVKRVNARLVIASNAWLTSKDREFVGMYPTAFDPETLGYWMARLRPLIGPGGGWRSNGVAIASEEDHTTFSNAESAGFLPGARENERIVVIANRVGIEPGGVHVRDLTRGCPPAEEGEEEGVANRLPNGQAEEQKLAETGTSAAMSVEPSSAAPSVNEEIGTDKMAEETVYAGSSCVLGLRGDGHIRVYGLLGRAEEKLLVVNTDSEPAWTA